MEFNLWKPLAGLALFLLALAIIEESIRSLAGRRFKRLLAEHTDTPLEGVASGTLATAILQSSSFVTLLMLAFVGARLLPLKNAVAVVIGANLGTTATGWLVATLGFKFDLEGLALPLIAIGGLSAALLTSTTLRSSGRLVLALGLLLLGLQFMKGAVDDAAGLIDVAQLAQLSAVHYLLIGVVFSAIVQSSSATILIALSALNAGVIDLPSAAAIAVGADFGTISTVVLGAIGASANKKRVALGHFLFNLVTDFVGFSLRLPLLGLTAVLGDATLQLVAFHSLMNVIGILLFLPLLGHFTSYLERWFTAPEHRESDYLDDASAALPEAALTALERETSALLERVIQHNQMVMQPLGGGAEVGAPLVAKSYRAIKKLEGEIVGFAMRIDRSELDRWMQERLESLLRSARSSVVALKTNKEAAEDLEDLLDANETLVHFCAASQLELYAKFLRVTTHNEEQLFASLDNSHSSLHEEITRQIRRYQISELQISTAFNINRMLYHSNHALADARLSLQVFAVGGSA